MKVHSTSFPDNTEIPDEFAFCVKAEVGHVNLGANRNPHFVWSNVPENVRSFALVGVDIDLPSEGTDVNQEGKTVSKDLPRVDFSHWVLVDIPYTAREIAAGTDSTEVTARGKDGGRGAIGVRGKNDYTDWFAGDPDMEGEYYGYDGPCPPWNDERRHRYIFSVYALDVETLGLPSAFGGAEVLKEMEGHILDKGSWSGTYSLNPEVKD